MLPNVTTLAVFNFDDIKSIDNNYQTMFRVLTERTKPELKKYGYYLDFNKNIFKDVDIVQ